MQTLLRFGVCVPVPGICSPRPSEKAQGVEERKEKQSMGAGSGARGSSQGWEAGRLEAHIRSSELSLPPEDVLRGHWFLQSPTPEDSATEHSMRPLLYPERQFLELTREEGTATHSSILAWEIPWTEAFMGLQRAGHD